MRLLCGVGAGAAERCLRYVAHQQDDQCEACKGRKKLPWCDGVCSVHARHQYLLQHRQGAGHKHQAQHQHGTAHGMALPATFAQRQQQVFPHRRAYLAHRLALYGGQAFFFLGHRCRVAP